MMMDGGVEESFFLLVRRNLFLLRSNKAPEIGEAIIDQLIICSIEQPNPNARVQCLQYKSLVVIPVNPCCP
jgi:hypothetical protein